MAKKFQSTPSSLWDSVSQDYEENSFKRRNNLYPANLFRYELILEFLKTQLKGKILDAGCGPGLMTRMLQKEGWDVTSCDYSEGMLAIAKRKALEEGLPDVYHHLPLAQLGKLDQKFSIVILNGVLPYVSSEEELGVFEEIKKVLLPGGYLIASHYNFYFDIYAMDRWTIEAMVDSILEPAGLPKEELQKATEKIKANLANYESVLDKDKTMKTEDPLTYKSKLEGFGFEEFDQAYYNLFYLPAKYEKDQKPEVREVLERKLRRDPKGLLLYRTFLSFAKLTS